MEIRTLKNLYNKAEAERIDAAARLYDALCEAPITHKQVRFGGGNSTSMWSNVFHHDGQHAQGLMKTRMLDDLATPIVAIEIGDDVF